MSVSTLSAFFLVALALAAPDPAPKETVTTLLIDDFSSADGRSAVGTSWRFFADGVMGGVSRGSSARETDGPVPFLRLRGEVSLENNGGFIQVALPLAPEGGSLDAGGFKGIRITVRGNGETYYLHLRTGDTRLPWQYYQASFVAGAAWRQIDVPFRDFRGESLDRPLDVQRLQRLGIVAAKKAFRADVAVARIDLYR